jgi:hypothetical protein
MNKDDIVRLAEEAELWAHKDREYAAIERFANLVAAAERKDCADIAEYWCCNGMPRTTLADQIRARSENEQN